ncbi:MAG: 50S ribosomal protein L6 [Clostridiales Family XIII bacterium]|jgi:large subunit ribosomal protein L6|nr:50S ribosomal protein L6 [Clostridiales Family XIII bacterium]
MSRIGRQPISVPSGVEVSIGEGNLITVKGPKGELSEKISDRMTVEMKDGVIEVTRPDDGKQSRSLHGLSRSLINNMVVGVSNGFEKTLDINGVGYRAEKKGKILVLSLGYSHPVELQDPDGVTTEVPEQGVIIVKGISKSLVGNYAAVVRAWRPPEPYKGKGIKYRDEHIRRKEGKAGVKGE